MELRGVHVLTDSEHLHGQSGDDASSSGRRSQLIASLWPTKASNVRGKPIRQRSEGHRHPSSTPDHADRLGVGAVDGRAQVADGADAVAGPQERSLLRRTTSSSSVASSCFDVVLYCGTSSAASLNGSPTKMPENSSSESDGIGSDQAHPAPAVALSDSPAYRKEQRVLLIGRPGPRPWSQAARRVHLANLTGSWRGANARLAAFCSRRPVCERIGPMTERLGLRPGPQPGEDAEDVPQRDCFKGFEANDGIDLQDRRPPPPRADQLHSRRGARGLRGVRVPARRVPLEPDRAVHGGSCYPARFRARLRGPHHSSGRMSGTRRSTSTCGTCARSTHASGRAASDRPGRQARPAGDLHGGRIDGCRRPAGRVGDEFAARSGCHRLAAAARALWGARD